MAEPSSFEVGDVVKVGMPSYWSDTYGPPIGSVGIVKRVLASDDYYIVAFFPDGDTYAYDYLELDLIRLNKET